MSLCNSPDIIQGRMSEIFFGLDIVHGYIDDLLHVTKVSWAEHLTVLKKMLARLHKSGIKFNDGKSCFVANEFEYLGYHVTRDGVMPIPKCICSEFVGSLR